MKNHVTSLDWSQKLKEAGFEIESISGYVWFKDLETDKYKFIKYELLDEEDKQYKHRITPAPLATELLAEIPTNIKHYKVKVVKFENDYRVYLGSLFSVYNKNLCNALAKMIIWLFKNGYMEKK